MNSDIAKAIANASLERGFSAEGPSNVYSGPEAIRARDNVLFERWVDGVKRKINSERADPSNVGVHEMNPRDLGT